MRSKTVTLKIPWRLYEAYEKLAPKAGYKNTHQLLVFNPLYALTVGGEHIITAEIAAMSPEAQDEVIERIVSAWERGETSHGHFLARALSDVVEKFKLPVAPETIGEMVASEVRKRGRKRR